MRAATIGVFDGVHRGHQALVDRAAELAGPGHAPGDVIAVTFDPHPLAVLRPDRAPELLTSVPRRIELLRDAGAGEVIVLPFTREFSQESPEEFVRELLDVHLGRVPLDAIVAGDNFRFGRDAAGDPGTLAAIGERRGFTVDVVPLITEEVPGEGLITWSSSYIRGRLAQGDVEGAARVLGRAHRVDGVVRRGHRRGHDLGYPTANVESDYAAALPADGVYAGWLRAGGATLPAAVSLGTNPQFEGRQRVLEAHAIGHDDLDLYGAAVGVDFVGRIRDQQVFESVEALVAQMGRDVAAASARLAAG